MSATNAIGFAGNFGSPTQLIIVLVIVLLLFGGKRLRSLGSDLGNAIKGFKNSMSNDEAEKAEQEKQEAQKIIDQKQQPTATTAQTAEKTDHKQS
ncbi:MAG TPA: twin-arginine translocase TatA/TatE family subunit [Cellvibrio sp.]|nr:twin-arginine translocase TatA/TatE family subunit [Cellvibrio sp.]